MTTAAMEQAGVAELGREGRARGASSGRLRVAAVSYLNAAPLVHGLDGDSRFGVERAVPSLVAERLHSGQAELGMIPSIELARGRYAVVPGVAITSPGPVLSVCLFLRRRVEDVRSVATDSGSRASVALMRLLLRERLGREPEYVPMAPDVERMLETCDGALVIGDAALDYEGGAERLDLGQAWREQTGLPFVWAFWAGRPGALGEADVARLQRALAEGLRALPEIARAFSGGDARCAARNEAYLRHNIAYVLGDAELRGLREFYARAHAAGLIPALPEIRFHGDR